ncbi:bifunctional phosphopantothenoylcysteine decarboxylase/phosphopantothenate--cysteine ligase CoaBC [Spiroplasma sp. BIUS-1]|uniref:bifunctional phosphopantothenoylcysteine decarboxylase/phosphopantothenate--cysteine ligase CoaBC n=1 Tax=Spiroplasma sp. BIUS-1 TaxID=216964 RepID=UPI001396F2EC|nr:bifunctional phosphopantothenoylcysteine decarboxylase/phosphopantothenate--cysteine ligase CoaBC [Spiroplasma sp. BIUS-1]QHX36645.1 phosphopantothenoylcysteine decarboxylase [Spiroplasma sp. BIUS-1]
MKKQVNLIVTGGIAASKSKELYDLLSQEYEVKLILTKNAKKFVDFKGIEYIDDIFDRDFYDQHHYADHIKIAFESTLNIVYPASYNFIGKIASGIANDIASLVFAVSSYNTLLFPSMNSNMYLNPILQRNKQILLDTKKVEWIEPKFGKLASGHEGVGRALEPKEVFESVQKYLNTFEKLKDKAVLLNFGKTRSYIDKVRYITNASSGKMGMELKNILKNHSKSLKTVFGDTLTPNNIDENNTYVKTNKEMLDSMLANFEQSDIVICSAALYDFEVENYVDKKIEKRQSDVKDMKLEFSPAIDVLKELGKVKKHQFLVGFSLANDFDLEKAWNKVNEKNLDMLVINLASAMESDYNQIKILVTKTKELIEFDQLRKDEVAFNIIKTINENI